MMQQRISCISILADEKRINAFDAMKLLLEFVSTRILIGNLYPPVVAAEAR
jgi:hypothetical protein